ncbi:MAG: hypothetical protein AAFX01_05640 [Cyanobacteria bacterium J06638_28]
MTCSTLLGLGMMLTPTVLGNVTNPALALEPLPSEEALVAPPTVSVINDDTTLVLTWLPDTSLSIDIQSWNVNLLDTWDCETYSPSPERVLTARRIMGTPAIDPVTGNIAVAVLLEECVEVQKSAVFIVDPQDPGSYALYRVQVPGSRPFPNEFSSYDLSSVTGLQYWESSLLVRHGDASGAEAMLIFRPSVTPAGEYAGCAVLHPGEGAGSLCPNTDPEF